MESKIIKAFFDGDVAVNMTHAYKAARREILRRASNTRSYKIKNFKFKMLVVKIIYYYCCRACRCSINMITATLPNYISGGILLYKLKFKSCPLWHRYIKEPVRI